MNISPESAAEKLLHLAASLDEIIESTPLKEVELRSIDSYERPFEKKAETFWEKIKKFFERMSNPFRRVKLYDTTSNLKEISDLFSRANECREKRLSQEDKKKFAKYEKSIESLYETFASRIALLRDRELEKLKAKVTQEPKLAADIEALKNLTFLRVEEEAEVSGVEEETEVSETEEESFEDIAEYVPEELQLKSQELRVAIEGEQNATPSMLLDQLQGIVAMQTILETLAPTETVEIANLKSLKETVLEKLKSRNTTSNTPLIVTAQKADTIFKTCWQCISHPLVLTTAASIVLPIASNMLLPQLLPFKIPQFKVEDQATLLVRLASAIVSGYLSKKSTAVIPERWAPYLVPILPGLYHFAFTTSFTVFTSFSNSKVVVLPSSETGVTVPTLSGGGWVDTAAKVMDTVGGAMMQVGSTSLKLLSNFWIDSIKVV